MMSPTLRGSPQADRPASLRCQNGHLVEVAGPGQRLVTGPAVAGEQRIERACTECGDTVRARVAPTES